MANKIQIRRDTAYNWGDVNPVLVEGEPGLETDTGKFKFGNGANTWVDLPYSNFEETVYNDFYVEGHTYLTNTTISGDLILNGNTQYIQAENTVYTDNLLEIHNPGGNIANSWTSNDAKDIGIRMHYFNGSDKNAALYMDNGDWILKWVVDGSEDNQGQFNHSGFGDFQANAVYANVISTTVVSNGVNLNNAINIIQGVDNTQNTRMNMIGGVDNTQNTRIQSIETINTNQNTTIGIIQGVDDGQNTRISSANNYAFSAFARANTALANTVYLDGVNNTQNTQIQGVQSVNTTQNTNITAVNNFAQGAYNKANSAATTAQAAFDKANTQSNSFSTITVANTASFNGLTQVQQLDLPYTAKTSATGTVTHDCSVGQIFYHTSISGNFTANLINLGITSGYITEVKLYLVQGGTSRSITALQIAGAAKTINWYNAVNPTYSTNAVDVVTFTILLVNTTYTVFGKVEKYDSVAAGGGGG